MDQSRALLLEAAAQGHMHAQVVCGDIYGFGVGVAQDERLKFLHHEKAARQGHMVSQSNMGVNYNNGFGCEQNYERAAEWFKKAAGQGHAPAMTSLGTLYWKGEGVPLNYKRAFELFQQSRALGNTDPRLHLNLGLCHEFGDGVTKDYLEARRLYTLASAQGYEHATEYLKRLEEKIRTECPLLSKRVVITGTSREDLNGRAVATSFDHDRDRYVVDLDDRRREPGEWEAGPEAEGEARESGVRGHKGRQLGFGDSTEANQWTLSSGSGREIRPP